MVYADLRKSEHIQEFFSGMEYTVCLVANWDLMVVSLGQKSDPEDDENYIFYMKCWHLDAEYTKQLLANPKYFQARQVSKTHSNTPDLEIYNLAQLDTIAQEVAQGIRPVVIDPEALALVKSRYASANNALLDQYGPDPKFSEKKVSTALLLSILYPLGVNWFYVGKPLMGVLAIASLFLVGIALPLGLIAAMGLLVYFLVQLLGGKMTDPQGLPILTAGRQMQIRKAIARTLSYHAEEVSK